MNARDEVIDLESEQDSLGTFENPEGVVERRYDADTSTTEAVVYAVAEALDADPLDLEPMHDTVDPDALDALFRDADDSTLISFSYAGCDVSISGARRVVAVPT